MTGLPPEATDLYGLTPGEFVAARNALVKQLKRDKRSDDATAVAALRRPSVADHLVNAAARAEPDVAAVWAAAVVDLADQQDAAIGGGTAHLREAAAALREATASLADLAASGQDSKRNEVLAALRAAATRPGAAMVAAGILGAGDPTDELFAGDAGPTAACHPPEARARRTVAGRDPRHAGGRPAGADAGATDARSAADGRCRR